MNINEVAVGLEEVTSALIVIGGYGMPDKSEPCYTMDFWLNIRDTILQVWCFAVYPFTWMSLLNSMVHGIAVNK